MAIPTTDLLVRYISADTLSSLQVLQSESHPHSHNQGPTKASSGSKEGLSVYGLFHHLARTPQGKHLLRQYFLRPSLNTNVINERLDTIKAFLRPDNTVPLDSLTKSLKQIKNIKTVMIHLHKGVNIGSGNGSGIKSGVWASLRSVSSKHMSWSIGSSPTVVSIVCIPYFEDPRRFQRAHGS